MKDHNVVGLIYIKQACYNFVELIKRTIGKAFSYLPINDKKIVFDNFLGLGYGGNPGAIAQKISEVYPMYKIIWIVNNKLIYTPEKVTKVKIGSIRAIYEYSTAKIWVDNVRNTPRPMKREGQYYLQTWHGSYGPKLCEKDIVGILSSDYITKAIEDGRITDAIIVDSYLQEKQFRESFWLNENVEFLRIGLPRNDSFCKKIYSPKEHLGKLGLEDDDYLILYAPTFRDDFSTEGYINEFDEILKAFDDKYHKRSKVLIRMHPNVLSFASSYKFSDRVINVTNNVDFQELVIISNCIITDYSSVMFDYAKNFKPVYLYISDLEKMQQINRISPLLFTYPFSITRNMKELCCSIAEFDNDMYKQNLDYFFQNNIFFEEGLASEKATEWIVSKSKNIQ